MSIKLTRRSVIACISVIACAVLVPIAMRAASTPGVLEACVNPGNGNMRLVDSSTACQTTNPGFRGTSLVRQEPQDRQDQPARRARLEQLGRLGRRDLLDHLQVDRHSSGSAHPRIFITMVALIPPTFTFSMVALLPPASR